MLSFFTLIYPLPPTTTPDSPLSTTIPISNKVREQINFSFPQTPTKVKTLHRMNSSPVLTLLFCRKRRRQKNIYKTCCCRGIPESRGGGAVLLMRANLLTNCVRLPPTLNKDTQKPEEEERQNRLHATLCQS